MLRIRPVTALVLGAVLTVSLGACGGGTSGKTNSDKGGSKPAFDAAIGKVYNASTKKGGTLKFAITQAWDSVDPGDTYYGLSWNFLRIYGRTLTTFKPVPGSGSQQLVGDLAENLGTPSDGGKTWTYKLRQGVKFEDGTPITSKDVKYAVLRTVDKSVLVNGPTYFGDALNLPAGYKGPYKSKGVNTDQAISTPDDQTIVFHLKQAFGGFDYYAQLPGTVPVPEAKDTGVKYKEHVVSSGPYMFDSYKEGKSFSLVRNPNWDPATDPLRPALPDRYEVTLGVQANDLDNRLIAGDLDVDLAGTGVQSAKLAQVLNDPTLKAQADNPAGSRLWYTSINPKVAPFTNIDCRKAVEYAADRTGLQAAYGGPIAGGDIASTVLPPIIPGYQKFDMYPAGADNKGDLVKAKEALTACGQPNGFSTNMAYRGDRPKERAAAESLQQSLKRVGINLTLKPFPTGDYFALYAGKPSYRDGQQLGLMTNGWQADWNDGYGFLSQIVDSRTIRPSGGSSNLSVYIPEVDQMLDKAIAETDTTKREAIWGDIDKRVMQEAVILPEVYAKALTLRSKNATNIFVNEAWGQYDYMMMGAAK